MRFDPSRLRRGELLVGASAVLTLVFVFSLPWYRPAGASRSVNGWNGLTHLRWVLLVTILAALALVFLQATRRAPAVPISMSVAVTLVGLLAFLWLAYRVLISPPPHEKAGAFLALVSTLGILYGGYLSMRKEGMAIVDQRTDIPTVKVGDLGGS